MSRISTSTTPATKRRIRRLWHVLSYVICGVVALITATPFVWMALGIAEECNGGRRISADFLPARVRLEQLCGSLHFGPVSAIHLQLISGGLDRYAGRTRFPFDGGVLSSSLTLPRTTYSLLSDCVDSDDSGLNYLDSHVYHRPVVRLVGHLLGADYPGAVQCLWNFSFATILSQFAIGTGRGRQNRWGFTGRSFSLYCSSFEPSDFGDTGRVFLACQLEQLSLAVDRDSISGDASRSAWDCIVRRRTFNPVAAHHGRIHGGRDPRSDLIRISSELSDRRY
jgi:hypothetical protein